MPVLHSRLGDWKLPHFHRWADRAPLYVNPQHRVLTPKAQVATIGSCFAQELARGMARLGISGAMHPGGLYYNTTSIRQELERIFAGDQRTFAEPLWQTEQGWVHPFHSIYESHGSEETARAHGQALDAEADRLFQNADVVVITLGLIEAWRNAQSKTVYRQLPHPDVFERLAPEFFRLSVNEMVADLEDIRALLKSHTQAQLILTVSPVPLHATMLAQDVRVANTESKARIRAAVSQFVEQNDDVFYFHSYELVTCAETASDFMMADGRHVHPYAVDYILAEFVRLFAPDLPLPEVDDSFLTPPQTTTSSSSHGPRYRLRLKLGELRRETRLLVDNALPSPARDRLNAIRGFFRR